MADTTTKQMKVEAMNGVLARIGIAQNLLDVAHAVTISFGGKSVTLPADTYQMISKSLEEAERLMRQIKNKEETDA